MNYKISYICYLASLLLLATNVLYSQNGQCLSGGCTGGVQYPSGEFSTGSASWEVVSYAIWPGEYAVYNVISGNTYEWSLCADDGGDASYDSQLTLLSFDGSVQYCYSDDYCESNAKIEWTATFTGKVRVLINKFNCDTGTEFTTLVWRCASSASTVTNDECVNAELLSVHSGTTCISATTGDVDGATSSGISSCFGTANNDVWYKFVATAANFHQITVVGSESFDAVVELRSGPACDGTSITCADNSYTGGTETILTDILTAGQTYFVRVYDYFSSQPTTTSFTICITAPENCTPQYSSGTSSGDFVDGVELVGENSTSISNITSGGGEPFVKDYTAQSVDLKAGFSYVLQLTNGDYGSQTLAAWIDYNNDGVYQESEKLGEQINVDMNVTVDISFTVPANASIALSKILVRSVWSDTEISPCGLYSYGEAEEYSINIISPCVTPATPISLIESSINDNSATISWSAGVPVGSPNITYYWAIGLVAGVSYESNYVQRGTTTGTFANLSSLAAGTQYYWTVKAVTSCDASASNYALVENFTTTCITPGTPQNLTSTDISTTSATLNWNAGSPQGSTAISYYWAVNTSSTVDHETNYIQRGITSNLNVIAYSLSPNTTYYWTVKAVTNCGSSSSSAYATVENFTTTTVPTPLITWTGNTDGDWNKTTNWNPQQIPTVTDNVIIPAGCTNYPNITTGGLTIGNTTTNRRCKTLTIESGAMLTVNSGFYVYVEDIIDIFGVFNHQSSNATPDNVFNILQNAFVTVKDGGILNVGSSAISSGLPAGTINQYNDLYIYNGTLNIEPGAKVFVQDNLVLNGTSDIKAKLNIEGGDLWIKHYGNGSADSYGFDIYANVEFEMSAGNVYICGQPNNSARRMIDWSADADISVTGGNVYLKNAQSGSTDNVGYVNFKGHTINNLIIDRDQAATYFATNTDNVIINGNLSIESSTNLYSNNLNFVLKGDFVNNGSFIPGTGTVTLKGVNKEIKGSSQTSFNNVTINDNASYTIKHTHATNTWIPIAGSFSLESGSSLNISAGKQLSISGNAVIDGNITAIDVYDNAVDVGFNGNYNLNGSGEINADVRITSNTRTLTSNLNLKGDLIIASGAGLTMSSHELSLYGSWLNSGVFTRGTGSVKMYGHSKIIGGSAISDFNNLTLASGSSYTLNPSGTSDRINIRANYIAETSSTLNIATDKVLDLYGSTIVFDGDTEAASNYDATRDIDINNTAALSGSGNTNADLRIYGGTTTLGSDFNLGGNFVIRNAAATSFVMTTHTFYLGGNWTNSGSGVFTAGTGKVYFNGTENRTIDAGGIRAESTGKAFYNLTVNCPDKKLTMINSDLEIDFNFEILNGTFETGNDVFGYRVRAGNKNGGTPKGTTTIHQNAVLWVNYHTSGSANETSIPVKAPNLFGNLNVFGKVDTNRPKKSGYNDLVILSERLYAPGLIDCDIQIYSPHTNPVLQIGDVNITGDLIIQTTNGWKNEDPQNVLTIEGSLYIYKNFIHNGIVNLSRNMTNGGNPTETVDIKSSTFNFNTTGSYFVNLDKNPIEFGKVTIQGDGTRVFRQNIDIADDLTIYSGASMDMYSASPKNLSLSESSDFINNGTFTPYTSTVSFVGDAEQNISGSTQTDFYNLEINNSSLTGVSLQNIANVINQLILNVGLVNTSAGRYVNLADQSNVSPEGGKSTSYINGPMRKLGRNGVGGDYSFIFPTGKNDVWAKIAYAHHSGTTATTDCFSAEYFDQPYSVLGYDESLKGISTVEYWNLSKISGNADLSKKVKLHTESKERSGIIDFDTEDLKVAHFDDGTQKWHDVGKDSYFEAGNAGWVLSNFVDDFSPFTFGSKEAENPLPVSLINFTANLFEEIVKIQWTTASEYNTDYYIVQRSSDMNSFADIGVIKAKGFSNQIVNYELDDYDLNIGYSYYRLKIVDFDKTYEYSNTVSVYIPEEAHAISETVDEIEFNSLYPNPANELVYIIINANQQTSAVMYITDLSGKQVATKKLSLNQGENLISTEVYSLQDGFYLITIRTSKAIVSKKFIKNQR